MRVKKGIVAIMRTRVCFVNVAILLAVSLYSRGEATKTRIAIIGLDHDHVWELLQYIAAEPQAELVAIVDAHPDLVDKAKAQVPATVKFFPGYIEMLDQVKSFNVSATTENDKHLEILRECAK